MREVSCQKHNIMVRGEMHSVLISRPVVMQGLNSWLIFSFFCS